MWLRIVPLVQTQPRVLPSAHTLRQVALEWGEVMKRKQVVHRQLDLFRSARFQCCQALAGLGCLIVVSLLVLPCNVSSVLTRNILCPTGCKPRLCSQSSDSFLLFHFSCISPSCPFLCPWSLRQRPWGLRLPTRSSLCSLPRMIRLHPCSLGWCQECRHSMRGLCKCRVVNSCDDCCCEDLIRNAFPTLILSKLSIAPPRTSLSDTLRIALNKAWDFLL